LRLLFLFRHLLLFVLFLVLLATLVSHAFSFSAIMTVTASECESYRPELTKAFELVIAPPNS
jgi:hypothetical protein